jgi:cytidine deaminase
MNKIEKHIPTLLSIAEDIEEPVRCYRLAAGIIYKNTLVSVGVNSYKTDPFQAKYSKNEKAIHLHAEVSAIKNALRQLSVDDIQKATLVVVRVKRKTNKEPYSPAMAKPCSGCRRCMIEFGIKNVYYTGEEGRIHQL